MPAVIIFIFLRNPKINNVNLFFQFGIFFEVTDHYVFWFKITMNIAFFMEFFKLANETYSHVENADLCKMPLSKFEDILETQTKFLLNDIRLVSMDSFRHNFWKTFYSFKIFHYIIFMIIQLFITIYLNCKLFICKYISRQVNLTKTSLTNFPFDNILSLHTVFIFLSVFSNNQIRPRSFDSWLLISIIQM